MLQNNNADNLTVSSGSTSFQFSQSVVYGGNYNVTVLQQPTGLTCTVSNGSGTNVMADVTNISVICSQNSYTIGGTLSGLTASGLVLQNNNADNLTVSSGSTSFQFSQSVVYGGNYNVTVLQQPTGLTCTVSNGSGTNVMADVTNIGVICSQDSYTIGGTLSGLTASGLVLRNNNADNLTVSSGSTSFQFSQSVAFGGNYNVTVLQQPTGLTCTISNGSGTNVMADVTNIGVICSQDSYTIGGTLSGLTASGLVLQNNNADNLTVPSGSTSFQFSQSVAFGGNYNVTVLQQPTGLTCTVSNGSGTNVMADVTNIGVNCGDLYVANFGTNSVGLYSTTTGLAVDASLISGLNGPWGTVFGPNGHLYVSNITSGTVGEYLADGIPVNASLITGLSNPTNLAFSPLNGNLYIISSTPDSSTSSISEYMANGTLNTNFITDVGQFLAIAIDNSGNLYVGRQLSTNYQIDKYSPDGTNIASPFISALNTPLGIIFDTNSNLYVSNFGSNTIGNYTITGSPLNTALISGLNGPANLAIDSSRNLFVGNNGNGTIGEYTRTGVPVNPGLITGLNQPLGLAFVPTH